MRQKIDVLILENDKSQQEINEQRKAVQLKEIEINELKNQTSKVHKAKEVVARKLTTIEEQKKQAETQRDQLKREGEG